MVISFAGFTLPAQAAPVTNADKTFCAKLDTATKGLRDLIVASQKAHLDDTTSRLDQLTSDRTTEDDTLTVARAKTAADYADQYKKLVKLATSVDQKKAVSEFQSVVSNALDAKKMSIDEAIKTYRDGVDAIIATHDAAFDAALKTMSDTVSSALDGAKTACTAGTASVVQAKNNVNNAVKVARAQFKETISTLDTDTTDLDALGIARKTAVDAAEVTFQNALAAAAAKVKTVFTTDNTTQPTK